MFIPPVSNCIEMIFFFYNIFSDVEDWSKYPLGVLPNQKLSYKSLELFSVGGEEETMEAENSTEEACETLDLRLGIKTFSG